MILQSENPIRMVRELKGAPLSIFIALGMVRQRVNLEWLVEVTGYTDKPLRTGLRYLREVGLVDENRSGWQLVKENAKQLPLTLQLEADPPVEDTQEPSKIQTENVEICRNNSDSLNYLSKEEVVNINLKDSSTNLLNLSDKSGKIPTLEEIQKVLDAAEGLFGHRIMGELQDYADIDRLLSWIAQAYMGCYESGRLKIQNPAGLVYWAFHHGKDKSAEKKYLDTNRLGIYLPESFMKASGQWEFDDEDDDE